MANSVIDKETGAAFKYRHLIQKPDTKPQWERVMCKELGRLAQGLKITNGMDTGFLIVKNQVPKMKQITYIRIKCTH